MEKYVGIDVFKAFQPKYWRQWAIYPPNIPLEAPEDHPTSLSAIQSPDLWQPRVIRSNPLPDSHPAAKPLGLDTEEGNFNTLIGKKKNPFNADLQLFTRSSVSVLTHRGLFKSTLLSFNKLGFFCSSSPPVQAQALSRDSGLFILCHWSELRDEELILKQFSVCCLFCFFWSFSSFFHAAFSAVRSLQGLHLLNPPPWIFTSLVALLNSAGWGGGGMSQLLQQEKVCENCIMQHLHLQWIKSSRFIHCFRTCQSPLNQITAFTQLRITPDAVSVWHSVILDEEREEKREKGKGKKVFYIWNGPFLPFISRILC